MIKNFFRTAFRSILKYKAYSIINLLGLTTGLALAMLIFVYVRSEISYDEFHTNAERIYRLKYKAPNGMELASTPPPIAPAMKDFFPEVEEAGRMYARNVSINRPESQESFEEENVYFADSSVMKIFSFDFVRGNPKRALTEKFTVFITEEMSKKYFGDKDPLGETLIFSGKHSFRVGGVVKAFPQNSSHIRLNMLVPWENMFDLESDQSAALLRNNLAINFVISHSYTYVLLKPGADPVRVDQSMDAFLKKYARPDLLVGQIFTLMPLKDIHLKSTLLAEPTPTNSETNLIIFIGVGILTLIIASINYINLSTAQSFSRVKEIGIRKVLGSMKYQLITQFIAESLLFCLVSMVLAFAVFYTALPVLNMLTLKSLEFDMVFDTTLVATALVLVMLITLMAGGYPAYFVTQFNSIHSLKGEASGQYGNQFLRRTLVVFQLAIACMLLSGSLLIVKQLSFLSNRPLGFSHDHTITIPLFSQNLNGIFRQNDSTFWVRLQSFRDAIEAQAGVKGTTLSSGAPGLGATYRGTTPEGSTEEDRLFIANMAVDYNFVDLYGVSVIAGRSFSKEYGTDQREAFMINESAVKEFNWNTPQEAIGKRINREGKEGRVIGVVKDYNFTALTTPVSSLLLEVNPNQFNVLAVKFDNDNIRPTLGKLEAEWNRMFPEKTFQFTFLDEQIDNQYQNFKNFGIIIQSFTFIAIVISCLGVYGLVLFVVQRKVKEIGVRKVLGASVTGILQLIYKDFAWLLTLGFVAAIPISYMLMSKWLENFTYRTSIDVFTYVISFSLVMIVVGLTIGYQALKASLANPVKSLRSE